MAYLAFHEFGGMAAVRQGVAADDDTAAPSGTLLTSLEWSVVAIARNDSRSSLRSPGWRSSVARVLFSQTNPRLADAHEQLVINDAACWVGDCMRRDPSKRDAFECYAPAHPEASRTAAVSFARLWGACEPVTLRSTRPPARTTTVSALDPAEAAAALAAAMAGEVPHIVVSTLH